MGRCHAISVADRLRATSTLAIKTVHFVTYPLNSNVIAKTVQAFEGKHMVSVCECLFFVGISLIHSLYKVHKKENSREIVCPHF